jgi:hypothetical protein
MSTLLQVEQLRTRANRLRLLGRGISRSRALTVYTLAGPDTWVGPTPKSCEEALRTVRQQLQAGQQSLLDAAHVLERRADELDLQPPITRLVS